MKDKFITALDRTMEYGVYVYVFALFNHHTTALSRLGLYVPFIVWVVKHIHTKGKGLSYLRHPVAVTALLFAGLVLLSTTHAPDVLASLNEYRLSLGAGLAMFLVIGDVFRSEDRQRRLLYIIVATSIYISLLQVAQYVGSYRATGEFLDVQQYPVFRSYSDALSFFLPFTLAVTQYKPRATMVLGLVFIFQMLLLVMTGARGAWLGVGLAFAVWIILKLDKRVLIFGAIGLTAVTIVAVVVPNNLIKDRIVDAGISSNHRIHGTWEPSIDMIANKPVLGYGYGKQIFHNEFNRRAPNEPTWTLKKSLGPHSNYLEIGFAAGLVALLSLVLLYAQFIAHITRRVKAAESPFQIYFTLAVLAAFVASPLVRGFVESLRWEPNMVILGIGLAILATNPRNGDRNIGLGVRGSNSSA